MVKGVDKKAAACYNSIVTAYARSKKNGVWHSLVVRLVREQIADYERKIYKTAETP